MKPRHQDGQITVLFIFSTIVAITVLAFVVNVGLYVKAKINLQNAVDAAAWSGAAVQSRQLSNIGYLNWEMRNVYKEWMFKYYILGNLSAPRLKTPFDPPIGGARTMDFRMEDRNPVGGSTGATFTNDYFNVPSVCIDFANTAQLCRMSEVPGLPEFNTSSITQIDYISNEFTKSINELKSEDCAKRSELNYFVARAWAYGVESNPASGGSTAASRAARIATDRPGAWPQAMELALRIRSLEQIVNKPPYQGGICLRPGSGLACSNSIQSIEDQQIPHNERAVKAFYAGYRNLGNEIDNEMKSSFVLTELAPTPASFPNAYSLSRYLTPASDSGTKHYLDLKLALLNLVTFYTHFSPGQGSNTTGAVENAACRATKTALPIPGYPLGFDKNPDVITYYAVKGEAEFIGLFNPFQRNSTKLTAYAAAKPFGGRIGPKLFDTQREETLLFARTDGVRERSYPYIMGLKAPATSTIKGMPIPTTQDFYLDAQAGDPIGGWQPGETIRFGIPNLLYEIASDMSGHIGASPVFNIESAEADPTNPASHATGGLFDREQYQMLLDLLPSSGAGNTFTPDNVAEALRSVRSPTKYEALNYLIPMPHEPGRNFYGQVGGPATGDDYPNFRVFAPLYSTSGSNGEYLFSGPNEIQAVLRGFVEGLDPSLEMYAKAMQENSENVRTEGGTSPAASYETAAKKIYDGDPTSDDRSSLTCDSLAGNFYYYIKGGGSGNCQTPLLDEVSGYFQDISTAPEKTNFYNSNYRRNPNLDSAELLSAYSPGEFQGASREGVSSNPFFSGAIEDMNRNYYSTKFVHLNSLFSMGAFNQVQSNASVYSEGDEAASNAISVGQQSFVNHLFRSGSDPILDRIQH